MSGQKKRSVTIRGHRTSVSVEEAFLVELDRLARARGLTFAALVAEVDAARPRETNLSSALRLHVLEAVKQESGARATRSNSRKNGTGFPSGIA